MKFAERFKIFSKENLGSVRALLREDGTIWFVAKDVCECLGIANNRDAVARLDEDEKNTVVLTDGIPKRGNPNVSIITESGLYALIMSARKAEARDFQRWVTKDVLPAIRQNGGYIFGQETLPDAERESLEKEIQALSARVNADTTDLAMFSKYITELSDMYKELKAKCEPGEPEAKSATSQTTFVGSDGLVYYSREDLIRASEACKN